MKVCVLTYRLNTPDQALWCVAETFRTIDHSVAEQRSWLTKHITWALHNRKRVEVWAHDADPEGAASYAMLPRDPRRVRPTEGE